jgi:hypothetical protein
MDPPADNNRVRVVSEQAAETLHALRSVRSRREARGADRWPDRRVGFDPAGRLRKNLGKAIWRSAGKPYPDAMSLFDLVRLHRQHKVWRFPGAVRPPLDTGMM